MGISTCLKIIAFLLFIQTVFNAYCSSGCYYPYNSVTPGYNIQCAGVADNQCQNVCDPVLYQSTPTPITGGTFQLLISGIYNTTATLRQTFWRRDYTTGGVSTMSVNSVSNWIQLTGTQSSHSQLLYMAQPHYGIRCQALFHISNNFVPRLVFIVNGSYSETVRNVPLIDSLYTHQEWIFTTDHISYRQSVALIQINRTDTTTLGAGDAVAFNDVRCHIAYCVPNCLSCASLTTCYACGGGKILNPNTKICETTCPRGMYDGSTGVCLLCDPKCDSCTTTATTCDNCTDSGPYQSFLLGTACLQNCTTPYINNYLNHKCQCPTVGYSKLVVTGTCVPCPTNCEQCNAAGVCTLCKIGFFMTNGTTTCSATCPPTQYMYWIYDIAVCYLCDSTLCVNCIDTSTKCTSCNFATNDRFLYNFTCLYLCPDGYEGNRVTWVCDLCPLGMYSYQNVCYSECPLYYYANDNIRACVLPGGYPLNMTISVEGANTLKFTIPLNLGLLTSLETTLNTTWRTYISMTFITNSTNKLTLHPRLLQTSYSSPLSISNAVITNNMITLYSTSIPAEYIIYSHSFTVRFQDNLLSPKNVIYSIKTTTSLDDTPWIVSQYFDLNMKPYYLIGIFLAVFGLLVVLMRTKYIYRIMIQYIHAIQLLGLTFYAIYPHSVHVYLYSFTMGLDFANFTFIYNVPNKLIDPCYQCTCLVSYNFASGDMNWLRLMGSFLLCLIAMLIFCGIVYLFKCSRPYSEFFFGLVIDLIIIKTIHGWFASLIYSGLNFNYNGDDNDLFILAMHGLSYFVLLPVLYSRIRSQYINKYINISFIFLVIFIILLTLLSLAPTLICALLMLTTAVQWALIFGLNITEEQKPAIVQQKKIEKQQEIPLILRFHNHLLRSIKPLTAFLVACIIMIKDETIPIALVSSVLGVLLITILVQTYFLYEHYQKQSKIQIRPPKSNDVNQTKQDLKVQKYDKYDKQTDYHRENNVKPNNIRIYDEDDMDDDVVANKFRTNKKGQRQTNQNIIYNDSLPNQQVSKSSGLFKNVE